MTLLPVGAMWHPPVSCHYVWGAGESALRFCVEDGFYPVRQEKANQDDLSRSANCSAIVSLSIPCTRRSITAAVTDMNSRVTEPSGFPSIPSCSHSSNSGQTSGREQNSAAVPPAARMVGSSSPVSAVSILLPVLDVQCPQQVGRRSRDQAQPVLASPLGRGSRVDGQLVLDTCQVGKLLSHPGPGPQHPARCWPGVGDGKKSIPRRVCRVSHHPAPWIDVDMHVHNPGDTGYSSRKRSW